MLKKVCAWAGIIAVAGAPLTAAPKVSRYEADVQTITTRKIGGEDRQVFVWSHRVVEMAGDWKRKTDVSADEQTITEITAKKVLTKTIRAGVTTTKEIDTELLVKQFKKLTGDLKTDQPRTKAGLDTFLSRVVGEQVETRELGAEEVDGKPCTISEMRMTSGDLRTQIVQWMPKDTKLLAGIGSLQWYSYRLIGDSAWLESAEILRNVKVVEP